MRKKKKEYNMGIGALCSTQYRKVSLLGRKQRKVGEKKKGDCEVNPRKKSVNRGPERKRERGGFSLQP